MNRRYRDHWRKISNPESSSIVLLNKIPHARILWVNRDILVKNLQNFPGSEDEYREHLLESCGYLISNSGGADVIGWADRYGGSGIGSNGGSGRSVVLNGYSVKGVGATSLIGSDAPFTHSSGGAYLEEAIREIIFSRFLNRVLPHGASPILAVIDTGVDHKWHLENGIKTERRVLIVRPFSLRPAHFERALRYRPADFKGKRADIARVASNFRIFSEFYGLENLKSNLERCHMRWAEQVAFAQVHNIALGSSPSNVSIDGEVLDFGAVSTLPYLANYVISPGHSTIGELDKIISSVEEVSLSAEDIGIDLYENFFQDSRDKIISCYENRILKEVLSVCGLGSHYEDCLNNFECFEKIIESYNFYFRHSTRRRVELISNQYIARTPAPLGLESIWSRNRPACLNHLADTLQKFFTRNVYKVSSNFRAWPVTREDLREKITHHIAERDVIEDLDEIISHLSTDFA